MNDSNSPSNPKQPSNNDFETLRLKVMARKSLDIVPPSQIDAFTSYLTSYKQQMLDQERYLDARDAANLIDACNNISVDSRKSTPNSNNQQTQQVNRSPNSKIRQLKRHQMLTHRLEKEIANYDEQTKTKVSELQKRQAETLESFETEWREHIPEQYRRPSKRLLELCTSAHELGAAGHYEEAQLRHDEALELEAIERQDAQRRLNRDYRIAKSRLISQYKQELDKLNESRRLKKELLIAQKQRLEANEQKRETVLRAKFRGNATHKTVLRQSQGSTNTSRSGKNKNFSPADVKLPPLTPPNRHPESNRKSNTNTAKNSARNHGNDNSHEEDDSKKVLQDEPQSSDAIQSKEPTESTEINNSSEINHNSNNEEEKKTKDEENHDDEKLNETEGNTEFDQIKAPNLSSFGQHVYNQTELLGAVQNESPNKTNEKPDSSTEQ